MRKLIMILCLGTLLFGTAASAQYTPPPVPQPPYPEWYCPHEDPDEICIVFDYPDLCCDNCIDPFYTGALSAYVVIQNLTSSSGLSGYEFCICNWDGSPFDQAHAPPNCFITGYTYPPGAINAATEPCFAVGVASPIANNGWCTLILTINLLIFCPDCWCFGVEPAVPASIPDSMVYADGADPGLLKVLHPCTGPVQDSCFMTCINCDWCPMNPPGPPVDNESSTWGQMKSLYR